MSLSFCEGCLEKQRKIDQLVEENHRLKGQLRYRKEKEREGFFGSSTPSAQRPVKANSEPEQQAKRGGAQKGHPGHGRKAIDETNASRVIDVTLEPTCPQCGDILEDKGLRRR